MAACETSDRACDLSRRSSLKSMGTRGLIRVHRMRLISTLIVRVIKVEIKSRRNTSDASDCNPTATISRRFITRGDVASYRASDRDPTDRT